LNHHATPRFSRLYDALPDGAQRLTTATFEVVKFYPEEATARLRRLGDYWTLRIGATHRALGREFDENLLWFWIGRHDDYPKISSHSLVFDGVVINGFTFEDKLCPTCGSITGFSFDHDAAFCPRCNDWLESACQDPHCAFCSTRPLRPLDRPHG
jgi:hypothetical protein